jgi:hypothetical protein
MNRIAGHQKRQRTRMDADKTRAKDKSKGTWRADPRDGRSLGPAFAPGVFSLLSSALHLRVACRSPAFFARGRHAPAIDVSVISRCSPLPCRSDDQIHSERRSSYLFLGRSRCFLEKNVIVTLIGFLSFERRSFTALTRSSSRRSGCRRAPALERKTPAQGS